MEKHLCDTNTVREDFMRQSETNPVAAMGAMIIDFVTGEFTEGEIVEITTPEERKIARIALQSLVMSGEVANDHRERFGMVNEALAGRKIFRDGFDKRRTPMLVNSHDGTMPKSLFDKLCDQEWRAKAICAGKDNNPSWFFPYKYNKKTTAKAKEICMRCPVRQECLSYAYDNNIIDGIYGGKDPKERKMGRYKYKKG